MWGGSGNDTLHGGPNFDTAYGGGGDDFLDAGEGAKSRLDGQVGKDRIALRRVKAGDDHLVDGGPGRDILDLRYVAPAPGEVSHRDPVAR